MSKRRTREWEGGRRREGGGARARGDGAGGQNLTNASMFLVVFVADVPFDKTINSVPEPNPSREWEVLDVQNEPNPNY
jgi:hypothetical protein